jgi:hypothetical protein
MMEDYTITKTGRTWRNGKDSDTHYAHGRGVTFLHPSVEKQRDCHVPVFDR